MIDSKKDSDRELLVDRVLFIIYIHYVGLLIYSQPEDGRWLSERPKRLSQFEWYITVTNVLYNDVGQQLFSVGNNNTLHI